MKDQPMHILTQEGILSSFSISQKLTEKEVNVLLSKAKRKCKNKENPLDIVQNNVLEEIVNATKNGTLPGIIVDEKEEEPLLPIKSIDFLNHMVMVISQKFKNKKLDKLSLCYFINFLVGNLNLSEEDFEDFHRRVQEAKGGDDNDDYE